MQWSWFRRVMICMLFLLSACSGGAGSAVSESDTQPQVNGNQQGGAIQTPLSTPIHAVSTVAGILPASVDGIGSAARFLSPASVATDGTHLYVADADSNTIRKVVIATGTTTTVAGKAGVPGAADGRGEEARFNYPQGIATDGTSLYVTDTNNCTIRRILLATGEVTTLAGTAGFFGTSVDGTGPAARFDAPIGIASDGTNLYVADSNSNVIRKIVIGTATVTTIAGAVGVAGSADGTGSAASFRQPLAIATDGTNLYVADSGNNTIRKVDIASGTVTTLAGTAGVVGFADGIGAAAGFHYPTGITTDGTRVYVADTNNQTIRVVTIATGAVTTLAGTTSRYGSADGTGGVAGFYFPWAVTTDGTNVYVADMGNRTIRKIVAATGKVTTLAGRASAGSDDGSGSSARFNAPSGVATDGKNLYIADSYNGTIRKLVIATGSVTTLAGTAGAYGSADGVGTAARFGTPTGVTTDGTSVFVTDAGQNSIRKIVIATGRVTTVAGGTEGFSDGLGSAAQFNSPRGITTDGTNLYVADTGNYLIRKVEIATGRVTTLAGTAGTPGRVDGSGTTARFDRPVSLTTDGTSIYLTDTWSSTVRRIDVATGAVSTFAGTAGVSGFRDGVGTSAILDFPTSITTDGTNLYVAEMSAVVKIDIATAVVTTVAGIPGRPGYTDGVSAAAQLGYEHGGITTDGVALYITDTDQDTIRRIQ